jgi:hypothetical protein
VAGNSNTADIEAAHELYRRLTEAAEEGRQPEIVAIRDAPDTARLVELLSDTQQDRAALFFRTATRWEESQRQTALRRLADAGKALAGLDLELARGLLARVDSTYLDADEIAEKDALLLEVSARSMELEGLESEGRRLIEEAEPKRRRWWRRG